MRFMSRLAAHFHDSRLAASNVGLTACIFVTLYLAAIYYIRGISSRDPGSWFFDPRTAYNPQYTTVRQRQAESFVISADLSAPFHRSSHAPDVPTLCVGIPSIAREGVRYLRNTVGSLLDGLTQDERDGIHLTVFIPHSNPLVHPAYNERWLANLADEVLLYNVSQTQLDHIVSMELAKELFREKGLYDYTYLLKACHATGAPHIAMLEDDVIAMDGWYHRTLAGLAEAERKTMQAKQPPDFLYLRLFYTEEFMGWNGEDWLSHTFWSLLTIGASAIGLHWARSCSPRLNRSLTTPMIMFICGIPTPLAIVLFFAAGKSTVLPLPAGVNAMNNYGCCSQGLVFPRLQAQNLIAWYEEAHVGFVDMLTEQYADKRGELRWALTPSVIQHVGRRSSKGGDDDGKSSSAASKLWNFGFELFDPDRLRREHGLALHAT